jgi:hypothetical protein
MQAGASKSSRMAAEDDCRIFGRCPRRKHPDRPARLSLLFEDKAPALLRDGRDRTPRLTTPRREILRIHQYIRARKPDHSGHRIKSARWRPPDRFTGVSVAADGITNVFSVSLAQIGEKGDYHAG